MPELGLRNLWKLHLIDHALLELRKQAANLDPGRAIQAQLAKLTADFDAKSGAAKALSAEQHDLELQQRAIADKLKKIDKELYSGKVINPREVSALQREIQILNGQRSEMDNRIMELWEEVPPAQKLASESQKLVEAKKAELDEYQKKVLNVRSQLEKDFKERAALRGPTAKEVPPAILSRYEAIRQKYNGIGMAEVEQKRGACSACGTLLAVKLIVGAKEGKVITCESCHRILYAPEGMM